MRRLVVRYTELMREKAVRECRDQCVSELVQEMNLIKGTMRSQGRLEEFTSLVIQAW